MLNLCSFGTAPARVRSLQEGMLPARGYGCAISALKAAVHDQLKEILLLIFDECHHTKKSHPYNLIMQEFYHEKMVEVSCPSCTFPGARAISTLQCK